ncbi:phosphatase PAP2 family protein [Azospirillum brasilense]|nr:phosphatase PAP2 family protein [Azospirillum brasilense]NUB25316.1 phosphatase PAP2 family protein [Azospirillum brasilense]NUB33634.1 phosphatase PAP2 family protein [Azospirillum brasilense]RIW01516.1 phosphatase PAP2 family protein [Azospirillum brasilense]
MRRALPCARPRRDQGLSLAAVRDLQRRAEGGAGRPHADRLAARDRRKEHGGLELPGRNARSHALNGKGAARTVGHLNLWHVNKAISLLGSTSFVLPVAGILIVMLWRRHSAVSAARWLAVLAMLMGSVALLKILGHACGIRLFDDRLTSPSGHAALAAAVYGAVGVMAARSLDGWRRGVVVLGALGLVVGVAASRILLRYHSVTEVVVGLVLGGLAVAAFAQSFNRMTPSRLNLSPLVLALVVLFGVATYALGDRTNAEPMLKHFAYLLREESPVCGPMPPLNSFLERL